MFKIGTLPFKTCNVRIKNIPKRTLTHIIKGKIRREIQLLPLNLQGRLAQNLSFKTSRRVLI